jgi:hypothetical protein
MPELRRLFPDIPSSPELPSEQERRYLFNGMRDFIARTGRNQPAVYVLDDLHWADDSALLLLQHIAQQLHEMPCSSGHYRDVETASLACRPGELTRLGSWISNGCLGRGAAMLRALSDKTRTLVQAVYSETETVLRGGGSSTWPRRASCSVWCWRRPEVRTGRAGGVRLVISRGSGGDEMPPRHERSRDRPSLQRLLRLGGGRAPRFAGRCGRRGAGALHHRLGRPEAHFCSPTS